MWRRPAAHDALRGRTFDAYPEQEMVVAEGVGHAGGPAARDTSSHRRGRQAPSLNNSPPESGWRGSAPTMAAVVGRFFITALIEPLGRRGSATLCMVFGGTLMVLAGYLLRCLYRHLVGV